MSGPLAGVRVLDLSRLLPGPACTWMLQGLGAAVDRVEAPVGGDFARHVPPFVDGVGAYFASISRGKRSLALDLRRPEAIEALLAILPAYDVVVEGFKPGVLEAMGLAPERMLARRPGLVVARLSGYGQTGPWRDRPGHDVNYVGLAGGILPSGHDEHGPVVPFAQNADLGGAMAAAMGIAAALFDRERTGRGRVLDVSLTEAVLTMLAPQVTGFSAEGRDPTPGGEVLSGGLPVYGTYACADGRWLTVGALEPKFRMALAGKVGAVERPDLAAAFRTRPRDAWVALLEDACTGPALAISELADHPQLRDRGAVLRAGRTTWVRPVLADAIVDGPVPGLGEHTEIVLAEGGLSADAIARLRAAGALGPA